MATPIDIASSDFGDVFARQRETALKLRSSSANERVERLKRLREAVKGRWDDIVRAAQADTGKPPAEVEMTEIVATLAEVGEAIRHTPRWMQRRSAPTGMTTLGMRAWVQHEPKGRCLIISPWNYPVYLTFGPLASCIAAGNTAILKPSEHTPAMSALIANIVGETFADHEVAVVQGDADVAETLLQLPFDHLFFTGSTAVGKRVLRAAAEHLASTTLELGGKSPVIVDASADLRLAARTILWAKCLNAGQSCIAPDHVYVDATVVEAFIDACSYELRSCYGRTPEEQLRSPHLARIVNASHVRRLQDLLHDAKSKGASVLCGGTVDEAQRFVSPTLLIGVRDDAAIMQEEIFGPLLPVLSYTSLDQVLSGIESRPKPLALYIWSRDSTAIDEILSRTTAGGTCINHALVHCTHPELPFGGVNQSGIGKAHGFAGFLAFSNERAVVQTRLMLETSLFPPYTDKLRRTLRFLARWS